MNDMSPDTGTAVATPAAAGAATLIGIEFVSVRCAADKIAHAAQAAYWLDGRDESVVEIMRGDIEQGMAHLAALMGYQLVEAAK